MREIKFRAWDKKTKKMRAVNSIVFHYEEECFDFDNSRLPKVVNLWGKDIIEDKVIVLHREIKDVELMRYTGLKDKNGKEMYEGDIVEVTEEDEYLHLEWDEDTASFVMSGRHFELDFDSYWSYEIEVIGNKFDNPELLEGGAE